jgi:hypothetical protein
MKPTNPLFYNKSHRKRMAIKKRKNVSSIPRKRRYTLGILVLVSLVIGYLGFKRD